MNSNNGSIIMLSYSEISSDKKVSSSALPSVSLKFSGDRQNATRFFARNPKNTHIIQFLIESWSPSESLGINLQCLHSSEHASLLYFYLNIPLCSDKSMQDISSCAFKLVRIPLIRFLTAPTVQLSSKVYWLIAKTK